METQFGNTVLANDLADQSLMMDRMEYTSMEELKQISFSVEESEERLTKLIHDHYAEL